MFIFYWCHELILFYYILMRVFGYGSLMCEQSLISTCPSASGFRRGILIGFKRVFNLVSVGRIKNQLCDPQSLELAAVAVCKDPNFTVQGVLFDIGDDDVEAYKNREHRYQFLEVEIEEEDGESTLALVCVESDDETYKRKCGTSSEYEKRVYQYYHGQLWGRVDILPIRSYLSLIRMANIKLGGPNLHSHFIDNSFTASGISIRQYIINNPISSLCEGTLNLYGLGLTDEQAENLHISCRGSENTIHTINLEENFLTRLPSWVMVYKDSLKVVLVSNNQIKEKHCEWEFSVVF